MYLHSLGFLCLIFLLSNCENRDACADSVSEEEADIVYYYNAYFDFFHTIESFDFEQLKDENVLLDKGSDGENAIVYQLDFPIGYTDDNDNSLEGRINYVSKNQVWNSPGNEITFEFVNFNFNGTDVEGLKIMEFDSETDLDWCGGEDGVIFTFEKDNTVFIGCLEKEITDEEMIISGSNTLVVNGKGYEMKIANPIRKENSCGWFTEGTINVIEENTRVLKYENVCSGVEMTLSNQEGCHSMELNKKHNLW